MTGNTPSAGFMATFSFIIDPLPRKRRLPELAEAACRKQGLKSDADFLHRSLIQGFRPAMSAGITFK